MLNFKGMRFPIDVILVCIRWYVAYPLSYRHLEEIMEERGVSVDHSSINRWAIRFLPLIEKIARKHKRPVGGSWRMDETYIKVRGVWKYLYRAVDKQGNTVDFLLTAKRDMAAAKRFFDKAIRENGVPDKVAMDKSGANKAAIDAVNVDRDVPIVVRQVKYLNNIVEQDHRAIKRVTSDQANAQLQIVPRRRLRARRRRAHAHDPQGPVQDRWCRCDVVRRPILCAGSTGPSSLRHPSSFPGKFRPRINNATQPFFACNRELTVPAHALLHGGEKVVLGDAGYQGVGKRPENAATKLEWHTAMRPGLRKALKDTELDRVKEKIEQTKASVRAKVEHCFHVVKCLFRHRKVRYRGLAKNTAQLYSLFALANLVLARRSLGRTHTQVASCV